ncbi:MAG: hypothetical protein A2Y12_18065 [Planctomycetes bacterium GWF2_42_9]|nr:MAG: hypothetical protein A2Y12_18065 [Planctomycetes bacterium GWF2_42_9]
MYADKLRVESSIIFGNVNERYNKMKKFSVICGVLMIAACANAVTITSMTANNAVTTFASGVLSMTGTNGLIQYTANNSSVTGTFSLNVNMISDTSMSGTASATFGAGSFSFKDGSNNTLLAGSFTSFNLAESFPGFLSGNCSFTVTGGSLQGGFGNSGNLMGVTFTAPYGDVTNFQSNINGYSTMVAASVPEPMTLGILGLGAMSILRKRKG